jgi:demethylmenaquinone methyltransferase/2-methoxy-6-polyprenyl-1,4-benzoquinol methylase
VVILEITTPTRSALAGFFRAWFDRIVPVLGKLSGNPQAYSYLPQSVRRFPAPSELAGHLAAAGLQSVGWIETAGGIIAIHHGQVAPAKAVSRPAGAAAPPA